jgi:hypothetical protein
MLCGGEPGHFGRVTVRAVLLQVLQAGDDGEIALQILQRLQVGRERVVRPGLLRKQKRRVKTERGAHRQESVAADSHGCLRPCGEGGHHRLQKRQREQVPVPRRKARRSRWRLVAVYMASCRWKRGPAAKSDTQSRSFLTRVASLSASLIGSKSTLQFGSAALIASTSAAGMSTV